MWGEDVAHDDALRDRLAEHLDRFVPRTLPLEGRRHAAVAVLVLDSDPADHGHDPLTVGRGHSMLHAIPGRTTSTTGRIDGTAGGAAILLTRRGRHLPTHARQWAFPGGRLDAGETALEAALRETREEVGLDLDEASVLGRLDDYATRSGYVITPWVLWLEDDQVPVANPAEVASVHRIALRELTRIDSPRFVAIPESDRPVVQMVVGGDLIHAPTGAVMYQFREVAVLGRPTRVAHLEQPVFAWR